MPATMGSSENKSFIGKKILKSLDGGASLTILSAYNKPRYAEAFSKLRKTLAIAQKYQDLLPRFEEVLARRHVAYRKKHASDFLAASQDFSSLLDELDLDESLLVVERKIPKKYDIPNDYIAMVAEVLKDLQALQARNVRINNRLTVTDAQHIASDLACERRGMRVGAGRL